MGRLLTVLEFSSHLGALRVQIKMEDYRVENEENKNREQENHVTNEKPPTASGKPKKKVKKVNVKVSDHAEQVDNEAVPEKSGNNLGDTLFILDLMRQRKEKLMRQKKDEKINEMAMKQKQQKLEARQGMRVDTSIIWRICR